MFKLFYNLGRNSSNNGMFWNISCNYRTCSYDASFSNSYTW